ncbi:ABC transporter ATP-binding protein [Paracoccus sp. S3-43]|uniref:ATP-binding cassette domain-containing protein n=1 Tax=Paracoccus sp. S3-43 TaxID=3030011 RepID=UPI0023AE7A46|nr:ABC transporter ATP-binding protein [Paracoccus sp. S3-43]WEF25578.1 ABC transporter ATP-binding protein [Paracoccus sp. S3-43]
MAALSRLGIADLAQAPVTRLSGGQRQMVLIARALAQDAATIIMDEPTASLDFANRIAVNDAIRRLALAGTAVILSTHDPDQAAGLGDDAILLNRGGVVASGPVRAVLTAEALSTLYGIPVRGDKRRDGGLHFY